MSVKEHYQLRAYQPRDILEIVALLNDENTRFGASRTFSLDEFRAFIESPAIDSEHDVFVVEDDDGRIVGYGDLEMAPGSQHVWGGLDVAEGVDHAAVALPLLRTIETRALAKAAEALEPHQGIGLHTHAHETDTLTCDLLLTNGYEHQRTFYEMQIAYDGIITPPPLPDGIELRPFDPEHDGYAVYKAQDESFMDHWGYEPYSWDEWKHFRLTGDMDYTLWMVAWDGAQIAGISLNRLVEGKVGFGWTMTLGVRRPWRKRGLGLALLQHSFAALQAAGCTASGLGVDASSLTNAVALYERAGMHVHKRTFSYFKTLREGEITAL